MLPVASRKKCFASATLTLYCTVMKNNHKSGGPEPSKLVEIMRTEIFCICNTIIYSCPCGSLLESVQEGKGEIRYHFRQHGYYACQSLGNTVTSYYFKVY